MEDIVYTSPRVRDERVIQTNEELSDSGPMKTDVTYHQELMATDSCNGAGLSWDLSASGGIVLSEDFITSGESCSFVSSETDDVTQLDIAHYLEVESTEDSPLEENKSCDDEDLDLNINVDLLGCPKFRHACCFCSKTFHHRTYLKVHVDTVHHNQPKPHECDICKKRFMEKGGLQRHITSIHNKEKPFQCNLCFKKYSQRKGLHNHMTNGDHSAEKQKPQSYTCHLCAKDFSRKSHLKEHIDSVHHKKRSFSCNLCPKEFFRKGGLMKHIVRNHNPLESYHHCSFCPRGFLTKKILECHVKYIHGGDIPQKLVGFVMPKITTL